MDLIDLAVFRAVAAEGGITRAARRLHRVQSNVTTRVRQWAGGGNNGWRLAQTTSGINAKTFNSSEYAVDPTLRPKLTVVYSLPAPNPPPTQALPRGAPPDHPAPPPWNPP